MNENKTNINWYTKTQIRKDILNNFLSSLIPKQSFRNKREIENAIRNIND